MPRPTMWVSLARLWFLSRARTGARARNQARHQTPDRHDATAPRCPPRDTHLRQTAKPEPHATRLSLAHCVRPVQLDTAADTGYGITGNTRGTSKKNEPLRQIPAEGLVCGEPTTGADSRRLTSACRTRHCNGTTRKCHYPGTRNPGLHRPGQGRTQQTVPNRQSLQAAPCPGPPGHVP